VKRILSLCMGLLLLAGCAASKGINKTREAISQELNQAVQASAQPGKPDAVSEALLPPLSAVMPRVDSKPLEARFDLAVNNTPAAQVFMAIVIGTRYSMLLHPDVAGNISLSLKDVTVFEALEAVREMYGYDYKVDGTRIFVQPLTLQTRIFQVNYLTGNRAGTSCRSESKNKNRRKYQKVFYSQKIMVHHSLAPLELFRSASPPDPSPESFFLSFPPSFSSS